MPIDQRRAIVRAETLIATEPFQSTEEHRKYLRGTCVLPQERGVILCATDGHTLVAVRQIDGYASGLPTVWHCQAKKRLNAALAIERKQPGYADRELWVDLQYGNPGAATMTLKRATDAAEIVAGGGETRQMFVDETLFIDGTFPEFHRVFAKLPNQRTEAPTWNAPFAVQPVYLHRAANLVKAFASDAGLAGISFGFCEDANSIAVTVDGRPDVICIIVPLRHQALPLVPEWITRLSDPAETEAAAIEDKEAA